MLNIIPDMRTDNMFDRSQSMHWQQMPANVVPSAVSDSDKTSMHTGTHLLKCREAMREVLQVHFENGLLLPICTPTLS